MTKGMSDGKPHKKTTPDGKQENLGEVRIKYTDCSKVATGGEQTQLWREPGSLNRNENVEILVNFAMASGETQNFSMPIYSGTFSYKCTFMNNPHAPNKNRSVSTF